MMPRMFEPDPNDYEGPRLAFVRAYLAKSPRPSLAELSRKCEKNDSYLWQWLTRNKPQKLPEGVRETLSVLLRIEESELREQSPVVRFPERNNRRTPAASLSAAQQGDIPLKGRAVPGTDHLLWGSGRMVAWTKRHPSVENSEDAFAVLVNGDSMIPRYDPNTLVYVDPTRPLSRGCHVLIVTLDDKAIVRQFLGYECETVRVAQLNPPMEAGISTADIQHIFRVMGTTEP